MRPSENPIVSSSIIESNYQRIIDDIVDTTDLIYTNEFDGASRNHFVLLLLLLVAFVQVITCRFDIDLGCLARQSDVIIAPSPPPSSPLQHVDDLIGTRSSKDSHRTSFGTRWCRRWDPLLESNWITKPDNDWLVDLW